MDNLDLISRNLEEVLTPAELKTLLDSKRSLGPSGAEGLVHYIGFEISGLVHLGTGLITALKIKDLQQAGVQCQILLADWHTWINQKLDGKIETIRRVALGYFREAMEASLRVVGADPTKVKFILGSDLYHNADDYWRTVIEIAKGTTLARVQRSIDILGRKESEGVDFARLIYPIMQAADIFQLNVNLAHAGMDQRKAHVIARDAVPSGREKPIALHHHLLLGLQKPPVWPIEADKLRELKTDMKMSKSKPDSCIFVHDSTGEIERKIQKAFCPPNETIYNPILDWASHLLLPLHGSLTIMTKTGGQSFSETTALTAAYQSGDIHPVELKTAVTKALQTTLAPIHQHFSAGKPKDSLDELVALKR